MRPHHLLLRLALVAILAGCARDKTTPASPFAGTYSGDWVAVNDTTDHGTSQWTISASGAVAGTDHDAVAGTTDQVAGTIDASGLFTAMATPPDTSAPAGLNGNLALDSQQRLSGVLVWQGTPVTPYRYLLTPTQ